MGWVVAWLSEKVLSPAANQQNMEDFDL